MITENFCNLNSAICKGMNNKKIHISFFNSCFVGNVDDLNKGVMLWIYLL
jgi:hypothetical protein